MPIFGNIVFTVAVYVVALLVIVFVHELGHYLVGRWTGIKAEVFSLGMGKRLWSRVDKHGTRWQIAAIPIGGYVKFVGDANAASAGMVDLSDLPVEQRRHSMLLAPLWARFLTVLAGPAFNFIFAAVVFMLFVAITGVPKDPMTVGEISTRAETGLQPGDVLRKVAGVAVPEGDEGWKDYFDALPVDKAVVDYEVLRNGESILVTGPHPYPAIIGALSPLSAARDADLREDDWVVAIDGTEIPTFDALLAIMDVATGAPVKLTVRRPGVPAPLEITLTPRRSDVQKPDGGFETRWLIGIVGKMSFEQAREAPGLIETARLGVGNVWRVISGTVSGVYHMAVGDISSCGITGPIRIAQVVAEAAEDGVEDFIWLVALLSAAIGFMNLFPIPVLDGGHIVFQAYEALARRKPAERAQAWLNSVGLVLVLSLMLFGIFNDFRC
jgi:regulator of sigma E protease